MSVRYFLDTNVIVYAFDPDAPSKQERAHLLTEQALREQCGIVSFQVVQEFVNVATRKFAHPLTPADCRLFLDRVLAPLCDVQSSVELYRDALDVHERWQYSFFDSLIIAAALAGNCDVLYSEDLSDGQRIRGLTIRNPFLD